MQWYQHTRPAQMQLILDDFLDIQPVARYGGEGEECRKEQSACITCGEKTFWVVYDERNPVAGCTNSHCSVEARMGLFEVLEFCWDEEAWGELPEENSERKKALGQKLAGISDRYLREEEATRGEALEEERRRSEEVAGDRDRWRENAKGWKKWADDRNARLGEMERAYGDLEEQLRRGLDEEALRGGLLRAAAAFVAIAAWLWIFLERARVEMLAEWGFGWTWLYVLAVAAPCAYLVFSVVYREFALAAKRNEAPLPLHERLGWKIALRWSGKFAACAVFPYIAFGLLGPFVGRSGLLAPLLSRHGVEWLLLCTVAGIWCVFSLCAWMAEDLKR